jgi:hypothetical protein
MPFWKATLLALFVALMVLNFAVLSLTIRRRRFARCIATHATGREERR